jgi:hypothetical protein
MASFVDITCLECLDEIPLVDADAEGVYCPGCDREYLFLLCVQCESVNQVTAQGYGGQVRCAWCSSQIRVGRLARKETATAGDWNAELTERGLHDPGTDDVIVGGFLLLGGSGFAVETDAICSVLTLPDAVDVRAEVHGTGVATIPYAEMTGLEIAGGVRTEGGGFIGGGFGIAGAAEGMLVSSILNSLTRRTTINTGLAISSVHGELLLNHDRIGNSELRRTLSPLFTRFSAARQEATRRGAMPNDPLSELERLADLRDRNLLTPSEFEAARSHLVQRLTDER